MLAIVGEFQTGHQFTVAVHARHAFGRIIIVDAERLIRARCRNVNAAQIQTQLDQTAIVRMRSFERFRVLGILGAINSYVSILTRGQYVFAVAVNLHVIQRILAGAIVAAQKLILLKRSEYDRFVGTARHHLKCQTATDELHRSYTARMIVQRL